MALKQACLISAEPATPLVADKPPRFLRAVQEQVRCAVEDDKLDGGDGTISTEAMAALTALAGDLSHALDAAPGMKPVPHISLYMDGGLLATWRGKQKDVVLRISPSGEARLHRVSIPDSGAITQTVEAPATAGELAAALNWFAA